jgi:hypothetical protein
MICFRKQRPNNKLVFYSSAKQTVNLHKNQVVIFYKYDLHRLRQEDLANNELWKIYWFGRLADRNFLKQLCHYSSLKEVVDRGKSGAGYKIGTCDHYFYDLQCLSHKAFTRYEALTFENPPSKTERPRSIHMYTHPRLLIKRGIDEQSHDKGRIVARYAIEDFAFSEWFYGVQLVQSEEWLYKTILGIMWSSFSRYFFFMTSSQWGLWYSNIHFVDELLKLPIVIEKDSPATNRIISIVDDLRNYLPQKQDEEPDIFSERKVDAVPEEIIKATRQKLEAELDKAVFELYGLNEEQRDLIWDCCEVTLPFFYKPFNSVGAMTAVGDDDCSWVTNYVNTFCRRWNTYLDDGEEMRAEVHVGAHGNMVAIEFYPADKEDSWDLKPKNVSWGYVLEQIGNSLPQPMVTSQILLDGVVHVVSENGVIIIKRNEKRFWTRSLAREDAEVTLCKRMIYTSPAKGRNR